MPETSGQHENEQAVRNETGTAQGNDEAQAHKSFGKRALEKLSHIGKYTMCGVFIGVGSVASGMLPVPLAVAAMATCAVGGLVTGIVTKPESYNTQQANQEQIKHPEAKEKSQGQERGRSQELSQEQNVGINSKQEMRQDAPQPKQEAKQDAPQPKQEAKQEAPKQKESVAEEQTKSSSSSLVATMDPELLEKKLNVLKQKLASDALDEEAKKKAMEKFFNDVTKDPKNIAKSETLSKAPENSSLPEGAESYTKYGSKDSGVAIAEKDGKIHIDNKQNNLTGMIFVDREGGGKDMIRYENGKMVDFVEGKGGTSKLANIEELRVEVKAKEQAMNMRRGFEKNINVISTSEEPTAPPITPKVQSQNSSRGRC